MANDLLVLITGAMDTSRLTILSTLCYLVKNKVSRDKVLEEIRAYSQIKNLQQGSQMNPSKEELVKNFIFLNRVNNESLRLNPPGPVTDSYIITKDVEFDGIKWKKDTIMVYWLWGVHHD